MKLDCWWPFTGGRDRPTVFCQSALFAAATKVVIAEAQYVMADGDTLATAEEKVLQRAQRRAVEEAGIYLESTFQDLEKESQGRTTRKTSWEIRTIAAAITETEILESHRSLENDRPVFSSASAPMWTCKA